MVKPTIILATSNGIGMGHLARATAIALEMSELAEPIILSVAGGIAELPAATGIRCEYIPGKNRGWIKRNLWDSYLQDRLLAVAQETGASVISFDGVVPYPGFIATKIKNPNLKLIWIRRGLWQKNALRFALPFQSRLVDKVIEPGDYARANDFGPTARRKDAALSSPVSLFDINRAKSRNEARLTLGLDLERPAVLVQLGTGDSDMNEKMRAALLGLMNWPNLQIVLTKNPVDDTGATLVPQGLEVLVVRYFPLAELLSAFDAAIAATGYNSVHELLPAKVPTVFISNIRGTDDQEARAIWCEREGFALRANQEDLADITETVSQLISPDVRARLTIKCAELPAANGATEIARTLLDIATSANQEGERKIERLFRILTVRLLYLATKIYRLVKPQSISGDISSELPLFSSETNPEFLRKMIKGNRRFEQLIPDSSEEYTVNRQKLAERIYRS